MLPEGFPAAALDLHADAGCGLAVPWIGDQLVTLVTGVGRGKNHRQCLSALVAMKQQGVVRHYEAQADRGAIRVQLTDPAEQLMPGM